MKIEQIKTGTRNEREGVFLAICSRSQGTTLMQMRSDGKLGFPGGNVDEGEDLMIALKREIKEEINLDIHEMQFAYSDFYLLSTHRFKTENGYFHTHLFSVDSDENKDDLQKIIANSINAVDFFSENRGGFIVSFEDRFFNSFIKNNFPNTVPEELEILKEEYTY